MNEETKRTERPWTPGPWLVSAAKGGWNCVKAQSHSGPIICGPAGLSNEANWTLLSASPELFEALQGFVDEVPVCCCHESWTKRGRVDPQCVRCNFKECIADAEAALAKALGGQP